MRIGTKRGGVGSGHRCRRARRALDRLPVLTCWPEDGGPFITLPLVYTEHPAGKGHNLGMYRLQVHDRADDGDALADRERRRISLRGRGGATGRRCPRRCFSADRRR